LIDLFYFLNRLNCFKQIGALHPDEQAILANWYNSLHDKRYLNWDTTKDLCGQYGVSCDDSVPQRVLELYSIYNL